LLSTPPHDGAVTLSYKPWNFRLERDFHSPDDVRFRAHGGLDESSPYKNQNHTRVKPIQESHPYKK